MDYANLMDRIKILNITDNHIIRLLFDFSIAFDKYNDKYKVVKDIIMGGYDLDKQICFKVKGFNHIYYNDNYVHKLIKKFWFLCEEKKFIIELYNDEDIIMDIEKIKGFNIIHHIRYIGNPYDDITFEIK